MTDLTPNDLSHLSDDEFNALCPQGYHAPGPAMTLSPAAQAVMDAATSVCHPETEVVAFQCTRLEVAAALRAAGTYLQNAYANEEPMDHADDFLLDLANELEALPND